MADGDNMPGDLSLVDQNQLQERIRLSKKQRLSQLKAYDQNEKQHAKQESTTNKKFSRKSKKTASTIDEVKKQRNLKIVFNDGVLMMDVIARKDIPECK